MSEFSITRRRPESGSKIVSPEGTRAVLDGIKPSALTDLPDVGRKPDWLRVRLPTGAKFQEVMDIVDLAGVKPAVAKDPA